MAAVDAVKTRFSTAGPSWHSACLLQEASEVGAGDDQVVVVAMYMLGWAISHANFNGRDMGTLAHDDITAGTARIDSDANTAANLDTECEPAQEVHCAALAGR